MPRPTAPLSILTIACAAITAACFTADARAAGEKLYGVHWWDYANPTVGGGPQGGWSVETIVTETDPWWHASWFVPLYQQATTTHNAAFITRIDYDWGQTVPAPATASAASWANKILSDVIAPLGPYAKRWVIGNEPNIVGEGTGWPASQITPAGYAQIYHTIRTAIKAQRPNDEVLFAPVSPGGVISGGRWKGGTQWLGEAIDATLALPGGDIDGFAIHAYGDGNLSAAQAVAGFRDGYITQLSVIDRRGLTDVPVYITEWNRATSTTGNLAANEQVTADFIRQSLADVNNWNRRPGNHNIRAVAWFVDNKDYGGWGEYSLEGWVARGNPAGHPGDLRTALLGSSELLAGVVGQRRAGDYNGDGQTTVADAAEWRARFGRTDWLFADGNRNGIVDAADYVVWRKDFQLAGGGANALTQVPEPACIVYLLVGLAINALGLRFRRLQLAPGP